MQGNWVGGGKLLHSSFINKILGVLKVTEIDIGLYIKDMLLNNVVLESPRKRIKCKEVHRNRSRISHNKGSLS